MSTLPSTGSIWSEPTDQCYNNAFGVLQVRHVSHDRMLEVCSNETAYACIRHDYEADGFHYDSQTFYYAYPLRSGVEWTLLRGSASDSMIYVPAIFEHEFGHVGGLAHTSRTDSIMRAQTQESTIQNYDRSAIEAVYTGHNSH